MPWLQRALLAVTGGPVGRRLTAQLTRGAVPILMLHRFADPAGDPSGHDARELERRLEELRHHGFALLDLREAVQRLQGGERLERAVVFTVDDGYADFATTGAPVFAKYDCPITLFVTTGFLDGSLWFWWDQVEYLVQRSERTIVLELSIGRCAVGRGDVDTLVDRLKHIPDGERRDAIHELSRASGIALPAHAPPQYAPMTWAQVRALEGQGVTFGPHSVTHPILSGVDDAQARAEIVASWQRLCEEVREPVPMFCYPNGQRDDFGAREERLLAAEGFAAALSTEPGFMEAAHFAAGNARFALPRFSYGGTPGDFWQIVGGVEHIKQSARRFFERLR